MPGVYGTTQMERSAHLARIVESPIRNDIIKLRFGGAFTGLYKCRHCKRRFNIMTGTMRSREPTSRLTNGSMQSICSFSHKERNKQRYSFPKTFGVTQKTAWFLLGRIRHNLNDWELPKFEGVVQINETYVGGKNKGRFNPTEVEASKQKTPVTGVLDRRLRGFNDRCTG